MSHSLVLLIASLFFLVGCGREVKQVPPTVAQKIVEVPVEVYVEIPDDLTEPCPIAVGPLHQIPEVARARKKSLQDCNIDKATIRKIQGKPVPKGPT